MNSDDQAAFLRALGKRVRLLRLMKELTQEELGRQAGVSRSFISLFEKGEHGIDIRALLRIAHALDLPLAELLGGTSGGLPRDRAEGDR